MAPELVRRALRWTGRMRGRASCCGFNVEDGDLAPNPPYRLSTSTANSNLSRHDRASPPRHQRRQASESDRRITESERFPEVIDEGRQPILTSEMAPTHW
jgi:hypothetical protein